MRTRSIRALLGITPPIPMEGSIRLRHDLAGPVSAVNNGAELLREGSAESMEGARPRQALGMRKDTVPGSIKAALAIVVLRLGR